MRCSPKVGVIVPSFGNPKSRIYVSFYTHIKPLNPKTLNPINPNVLNSENPHTPNLNPKTLQAKPNARTLSPIFLLRCANPKPQWTGPGDVKLSFNDSASRGLYVFGSGFRIEGRV